MVGITNNIMRPKAIRNVIISAFVLRLFMLGLILIWPNMAEGFIGGVEYDDVRYLTGAEYYAEHATHLFDLPAFTEAYDRLGDWTGHHIAADPINTAFLWYLIVCGVLYFTKTRIAVLLLNLIFSVTAILYVYKFAELVYGSRTALLSAKLLAYLPYSVIFSCFAYKEQLVMLCTFYLLYISVQYRYNNCLSRKSIFSAILAAAAMWFLRSGLAVLLYLICFTLMFLKKIGHIIKKKNITYVGIACLLGIVALVVAFPVIRHKFIAYLGGGERTVSTLSLISVTGIKDIYKLPLAYVFSIVMPIGFSFPVVTWGGVVSNLNLIMAPISIGAAFYLLKKKPDPLVYWMCLGYYSLCIITSIGIFRQYSSLLPINLIAFSDCIYKMDKEEKGLWIFVSALFAGLLFVYYGFR